MREKFLIRIVFEIFSKVYTLFANYILTLKLQVVLYGMIAFTNSFLGLSLMFVDLGISFIYSQYNHKENYDDFFSIFLLVKSVLIVANYIPFTILCFTLNLEPELQHFIFLNIIAQIILQFAAPMMVNLISRLKIINSTIVSFTISIIQNSLILYVAININSILNPLELLGYILIISAIINFFLLIVISRRDIKFKKIKKENLINFIKDTRPLVILGIMTALTNNIGKLIIDASFGSEVLAYYYFVEAVIINTLLVIPLQISQILTSFFPKEFNNNELDNITEMTHMIEKFSSLFYLTLIMFVYLHGQLLFMMFLPNYMNSVIFLYILIFIPFFSGITQPYIDHLIPNKRQRLYSNYQITKLIIMFVLIILLVPDYLYSIKTLGLGPIGLAFILLSGYIADVFFYRLFSKKIGILINKRVVLHTIYAFIAFIITFLISSFLLRTLIVNDIIYILVSSTILFGVFLIELIYFKELDKTDKEFLLSLLKISRYKRSIYSEMKSDSE